MDRCPDHVPATPAAINPAFFAGPSLDRDPRFKRPASMRHIVPSTSVSCNGPFCAAKVSSMRTESGTSGTGHIKDYSASVDNFADEARVETADRLRKSLAQNTYRVSAADLARKIIEHMMQL